jgi:hypothetical protein
MIEYELFDYNKHLLKTHVYCGSVFKSLKWEAHLSVREQDCSNNLQRVIPLTLQQVLISSVQGLGDISFHYGKGYTSIGGLSHGIVTI